MEKLLNRKEKRDSGEIRNTTIIRNYLKYPPGSVLISAGETKIICTATIEEKVPPHKKGTGSGWITAEYSLLPGSTQSRSARETHKIKGRTQEIQRLIGRALRSVVDLRRLGERTILIDADVIQADGGTRTAAVTGSFVALYDAVRLLIRDKKIPRNPINEFLAAVSVGIVSGEQCLDLDYSEDFKAEVDMNIVATESGKLVEVQGTAEGSPFSPEDLEKMVKLSLKGIKQLIIIQKQVLDIK
jgi:ribonuclease PH